MQNQIISLPRNSDNQQFRVHSTRARRFVDHATGDCATTTVSLVPAKSGRANDAVIGQCDAKLPAGQLNERLQVLTRAILLPNLYAKTR